MPPTIEETKEMTVDAIKELQHDLFNAVIRTGVSNPLADVLALAVSEEFLEQLREVPPAEMRRAFRNCIREACRNLTFHSRAAVENTYCKSG